MSQILQISKYDDELTIRKMNSAWILKNHISNKKQIGQGVSHMNHMKVNFLWRTQVYKKNLIIQPRF